MQSSLCSLPSYISTNFLPINKKENKGGSFWSRTPTKPIVQCAIDVVFNDPYNYGLCQRGLRRAAVAAATYINSLVALGIAIESQKEFFKSLIIPLCRAGTIVYSISQGGLPRMFTSYPSASVLQQCISTKCSLLSARSKVPRYLQYISSTRHCSLAIQRIGISVTVRHVRLRFHRIVLPPEQAANT